MTVGGHWGPDFGVAVATSTIRAPALGFRRPRHGPRRPHRVTGCPSRPSVDPAGIAVDTLLDRARRLGFRDDDLADLRAAAAPWLGDLRHRHELADRAERVRAGIGELTVSGDDPWAGLPAGPDNGLLPLLALLITADEVVAYQVGRGVAEDTAWRNLSDLGQQVWVHRLTYGRFGLHTHGWLRIAWAGGFAWLGRLQFNLQHLPDTGEWVLVDPHPAAQLRRRRTAVGSAHPGECRRLVRAGGRLLRRTLPGCRRPATSGATAGCSLRSSPKRCRVPTSRRSSSAGRWMIGRRRRRGRIVLHVRPAARPGPLDLGALPRTTSLERAVLDRLDAGEHWTLRRGRIPQASTPQEDR